MTRRTLARASVGVLLVTLVLAGALAWHTWQAAKLATSPRTAFSGATCRELLQDVVPAQIVMSEKESRIIHALLSNKGKRRCDVRVVLAAPNFRVEPEKVEPIMLEPGKLNFRVGWVVAAQQPGDFEVLVQAAGETRSVGVLVTSVLGLPAGPAAVLTVLGAILGASGLSIPWLYDRFREWRSNRKKPGAKRRGS